MRRLLEIDGLSKSFGRVTAVDAVSFAVERGEVLGFLGPNGAGKSTTMKMLTGFLSPSAGTARVCGFDVVERPIEVKRRVGYLPEGAPLYGDMTPAGLLGFTARARGLAGAEGRRRIAAVVERLELEAALHRPIETLSKGFQRRVGLAQALLHDPEVLILDEPTDGLDPNQKQQVRDLLTELAGAKAIIVSTHILEEVEAVCSRSIIVSRGRIVADQTPAALLARSHRHQAVNLGLAPEVAERAAALLDALPEVARVEDLGRADGRARLLALPRDGRPIVAAVRGALEREHLQVDEMWVERGRLDEVFRELTRGA